MNGQNDYASDMLRKNNDPIGMLTTLGSQASARHICHAYRQFLRRTLFEWHIDPTGLGYFEICAIPYKELN